LGTVGTKTDGDCRYAKSRLAATLLFDVNYASIRIVFPPQDRNAPR
jgi:hypothetical protein